MSWNNNAGNYISQQQIICMLQSERKSIRSGVLKAKGLNNPAMHVGREIRAAIYSRQVLGND